MRPPGGDPAGAKRDRNQSQDRPDQEDEKLHDGRHHHGVDPANEGVEGGDDSDAGFDPGKYAPAPAHHVLEHARGGEKQKRHPDQGTQIKVKDPARRTERPSRASSNS